MADQRNEISSGEVTAAGGCAGEIGPTAQQEHPGVALFLALRGLGAETFASGGGGEAWLDAERRQFYGPEKSSLA
jgi:hypothetical protein